MKFDLSSIPQSARPECQHPKPGDVYVKRGGPPGYWVVVAVTPSAAAYVLSLNMDGEITGSNCYPPDYFVRRDDCRVGHVVLPDMIAVEWR